jgi:hypothetical protein
MVRPTPVWLSVLVVAAGVLAPDRWLATTGVVVPIHAQGAIPQTGLAQSYEGILNVLWADPLRGSAGPAEIQYHLALPDGQTLRLQLAGQENAALGLFGQRVVVTGRAAARPATVVDSSESAIIVDSIGPAQPFAQGAAADVSAAPVSGTK